MRKRIALCIAVLLSAGAYAEKKRPTYIRKAG